MTRWRQPSFNKKRNPFLAIMEATQVKMKMKSGLGILASDFFNIRKKKTVLEAA